jgi:hypothetical protein
LAQTPKDDNALEEWKASRDVLAKFDDRILDLRKIGFSLLTALLAAQSLLIPSFYATAVLPSTIKLTVITATLLLIVTVRLIEKNYQLFQEAAATRAVVIERNLNFELTETISDRSKSDKFSSYVTGVYLLFAIVAGIVGFFVILPNYQISQMLNLIPQLLRTRLLVLMVLITIVILFLIDRVPLGFSHYLQKDIPVDWTLDKVNFMRGEFVGITLTNCSDKSKDKIRFKRNKLVWEIMREDSTSIHKQYGSDRIVIPRQGSYTWFWDTNEDEGKVHKGPVVYRLFVDAVPAPVPTWTMNLRKITGKKGPHLERAMLRREITVYPKNYGHRQRTQNLPARR